jgi:hypothetical protein
MEEEVQRRRNSPATEQRRPERGGSRHATHRSWSRKDGYHGGGVAMAPRIARKTIYYFSLYLKRIERTTAETGSTDRGRSPRRPTQPRQKPQGARGKRAAALHRAGEVAFICCPEACRFTRSRLLRVTAGGTHCMPMMTHRTECLTAPPGEPHRATLMEPKPQGRLPGRGQRREVDAAQSHRSWSRKAGYHGGGGAMAPRKVRDLYFAQSR